MRIVDGLDLLRVIAAVYLLTAFVASSDNAVWMTHQSVVDDDDNWHSRSLDVDRLRQQAPELTRLKFQYVVKADVPHSSHGRDVDRRRRPKVEGDQSAAVERTSGHIVSDVVDADADRVSNRNVDDDELVDSSFGVSRPPQVPSNDQQSSGGIQRLPQAIIIGVKKGGTRALLEFLRIHPQVRAPGPEVHFFDRHYDRGLDWYRSQMPRSVAGQITIEKTPSYFVTKMAPDRIYNMSRDIRLIVVVRDPVTRAISDYVQAFAKRPELPPFERMALVDPNNIAQQSAASSLSSSTAEEVASWQSVATSWGAVKIGIYTRHLRRWMRRFPLDRIHFVNGERLITDPASEIATLQDFLRLPRFVDSRHFYFNATKGFPCLRKSVATWPANGVSRGAGEKEVVRCLGKSKGRSHPDIDSTVIQRLRDFFRPYNEKFYRMTGIDFEWP